MMSSVDESDGEPMSTEMLEDIWDGSKSHLRVNRREARFKYVIALNQYKKMKNSVIIYAKHG